MQVRIIIENYNLGNNKELLKIELFGVVCYKMYEFPANHLPYITLFYRFVRVTDSEKQ